MIEYPFIKISLIILVTLAVSILMRILKQPLIIGYVLSGVLVGPYFFDLIHSDASINAFSQIGVALLLFTVGLHLNPTVIREVGKASFIVGIGQVLFTSIIGFAISKLLGFSNLTSFYISAAVTFSSAIIVTKLLSDKGDLESVYGKISIGVLILQDLVAVFILMIISSVSVGQYDPSLISYTFLRGVIVMVILSLFVVFILPLIMKLVARSQEFLFLFSISWCIGLASLFNYLNFSLEIGALLSGIFLSTSPYSREISSKLRPLRDFFVILFFIIIGSQMVVGHVQSNIVAIAVISFFVLFAKPLIVMILMKKMGYTKRNGFMTGLTVAQISEFSIIMIALGASAGHIPQEILSIITVVGMITIGFSAYMTIYSHFFYTKIAKLLNLFDNKKEDEKVKITEEYDAILFGYNRIGFGILKSLKKINKKYLVVDFNPEAIAEMKRKKIPCLYGDVDDFEFLEDLPLSKTQIIISTIPDFETSLLLLETIRSVNQDAIVILRSDKIEDALALYRKKATYVLTSHFLGGEYVSNMISTIRMDEKGYDKEREKHMELLKEMLHHNKQHPRIEKG